LPGFVPPKKIHPQFKSFGELAQLGERLVCNQEVTGSSPVFSTIAFGSMVRYANLELVI
jgi:hypothetical protein